MCTVKKRWHKRDTCVELCYTDDNRFISTSATIMMVLCVKNYIIPYSWVVKILSRVSCDLYCYLLKTVLC